MNADCSGELGVSLIKHTDDEVRVPKVARMAQLALEKIATPVLQEVKEWDSMSHGESGFGSIGFNITI